jgi:hypothetical protein
LASKIQSQQNSEKFNGFLFRVKIVHLPLPVGNMWKYQAAQISYGGIYAIEV